MFRIIRVPGSRDKFFRPLHHHFHWDRFEYFRLLVLARRYPFWISKNRHGKLYDLDDDRRGSMLMVPKEFVILMTTFAPLFTTRVWRHVQVLLVGAILAPGKRTVTAALRVMGLAHVKSLALPELP
jgi:hypothetical protein